MRYGAPLLIGALALVASACRQPADQTSTALRAFEAGRRDALPEAEIEALFVLEGAPGSRARLLDALAVLGSAAQPEVRATTLMEDGTRAAVDVAAQLPGGGRVSFTFEMRRVGDGPWRVSAFWGPGTGWPDRAAPAAEGLTVSPQPR